MKNGHSLIEILIIIALLAVLPPPLLMTMLASKDGKVQQNKRFEATSLLKETQEAVRLARENGWAAVSTPGIYHPTLSGSTWNLTAGTEVTNGFIRKVEIFDVNRLNNQIVDTGGSPDPSTKRIVIDISWDEPIPTSISSTMYLTRYLENSTYEQTTQAEFDTGTLTDAITTNNAGGEVTLGAGGGGNWCNPELSIAAVDLPKSGVANALTAIEGQAFASTGENSSGISFARININNSNPPTAVINGTIDGYKTNDVFVQSTYAYIATDSNQRPVAYINLSTMTVTGGFNGLSGNAESIFVVNNTGYVTAGNNFYTFSVSNKNIVNNTALDSVTLPGTGTAIAVVNGYAYVSISGSTTKLQIIDVTNPSNISLRGTASFTAGNAQDVTVNDTGTRAYIVTSGTGNQNAFFIINTENKTGSRSFISRFTTDPMSPRAVVIVPGNKAIIGGYGGVEYQVINIQNELSPTSCGSGLNLNFNINDLATVLESDGDAYTYLLTTNASSEFQIIAGGPGGTYSSSGIYESATFDVGYGTAFNRIIPTYTNPINTTIQLQIAIADAVSGSCSGANYVFTGPDGTVNTFYTGTEPIFFNDDGIGYENPGRCMRYRVYLETTDSNSTPIFEDITINYSP